MPPPVKPQFLAALESARQAAGASQARLAKESGDDPQAVERLTKVRAVIAAEMERLDRIRRASAPPLPVAEPAPPATFGSTSRR